MWNVFILAKRLILKIRIRCIKTIVSLHMSKCYCCCFDSYVFKSSEVYFFVVCQIALIKLSDFSNDELHNFIITENSSIKSLVHRIRCWVSVHWSRISKLHIHFWHIMISWHLVKWATLKTTASDSANWLNQSIHKDIARTNPFSYMQLSLKQLTFCVIRVSLHWCLKTEISKCVWFKHKFNNIGIHFQE